MSRNHRNRSWRAQWVVDEDHMAARHRSGVVAMLVGGEVLVDTSRYEGIRECDDEIFLLQAQRLFESLEPEPYARRAEITSATRRALAMIVNVGLTAPMDGKKLASVT